MWDGLNMQNRSCDPTYLLLSHSVWDDISSLQYISMNLALVTTVLLNTTIIYLSLIDILILGILSMQIIVIQPARLM